MFISKSEYEDMKQKISDESKRADDVLHGMVNAYNDLADGYLDCIKKYKKDNKELREKISELKLSNQEECTEYYRIQPLPGINQYLNKNLFNGCYVLGDSSDTARYQAIFSQAEIDKMKTYPELSCINLDKAKKSTAFT